MMTVADYLGWDVSELKPVSRRGAPPQPPRLSAYSPAAPDQARFSVAQFIASTLLARHHAFSSLPLPSLLIHSPSLSLSLSHSISARSTLQ